MKGLRTLAIGTAALALLSASGFVATAASAHHQTSSNVSSNTLTRVNNYNYLQAVGVMDEFLSDWQNHDAKAGVALLTQAVKKGHTEAQLTAYFAATTAPSHAGYEVVGFKAVFANAFDFHVWMYGYVPGLYGTGNNWSRPQPQIVKVIHEKGYWYINNLPKLD